MICVDEGGGAFVSLLKSLLPSLSEENLCFSFYEHMFTGLNHYQQQVFCCIPSGSLGKFAIELHLASWFVYTFIDSFIESSLLSFIFFIDFCVIFHI